MILVIEADLSFKVNRSTTNSTKIFSTFLSSCVVVVILKIPILRHNPSLEIPVKINVDPNLEIPVEIPEDIPVNTRSRAIKSTRHRVTVFRTFSLHKIKQIPRPVIVVVTPVDQIK